MDRPATRDDMASAYSDTYKEVYGIRPAINGAWTFQDFADALDQLAEESEAMHSAPASGAGWSYEGDLAALDF